MGWTDLLGLVSFGIAGAGSPGPNNTLLLASGVNFGFTRTLPHVFGAALGVGALVIAAAAGVGALLEVVPGSQVILQIGGSLYLLYLAFRIAGTSTVKSAVVAKPLSAWEAGIFQLINPKAWLVAIGLVAAFLPRAMPTIIGGPLVAAIQSLVCITAFSVWAMGGAALSRLLTNEGAVRTVNLGLAILLVASVALLWM